MKTSAARLIHFNQNASIYIEANPKDDKVNHVLRRVSLRIEPIFKEYNDLREDIEIELANTDKNGSILKTFGPNGNVVYDFTKENWKLRKKRFTDLIKEERFEIKSCIIPLPDNFPEDFREVFEGLIFEVQVPELEQTEQE